MAVFRLSSQVRLWCLSSLVVISACGRSNSGTLSVRTRPEVVEAAQAKQAAKDASTCLEPAKVLAGVEYTCADGNKRKGMFLAESLPACSKDGDVGCVATSRFKAADTQSAMPGVIKSGVTIAGVAGTLTFQGPVNCATDGETGCVSTPSFPAVDKTLLTPGVLKSGVTVAGVAGAYPSASFPLAGADGAVADLSDLSPTIAAGTYEFFDSAGVRKTGQIVDQGTVTPGLADQTISASSGLMRSVVVKGDAGLLAVNIKGGVSLFGVAGSIAGVPATCSSDGQSNCVASASYPAANATGLASKVLSGQTVAGVAGNVALPAASAVRSSVTFGVGGNGTTGSLGNCAAEGASGCVVDAATTFRAASTTGLAAKVLTGQSVAGVSGSAALRPADCAADGSTNCVAVTGFVAADTTGLASKVLSGQTVAGVAGNVTLPAASAVRTSATFGAGGAASGTLADCALDGATGCVATVGFPAANLSYLSPGNIKKTATIGGVAGDYPSSTYPLPGASGTDLPSLSASVAAGAYQFWQKDGTRVTGNVTDAGSITVGTADQTFSSSLYRAFTVPGDADLVAANIASGVNILGVAGSAVLKPADCSTDGSVGCVTTASYKSATISGLAAKVLTGQSVAGVSGSAALRPADCAADGSTNCVAVTGFVAADTTGLASKVLSGQTVAGVAGNVTLPAASAVRTSATFGAGGATTGTLADCALDGATGCVATVGFPAANLSYLSPGNIKKSSTIGGVTGDYPSATNPLAGATATTDLTSLAASTAAGSYEFFDSAGTRYTGSISDAGSITVGTTNQTFNTSLYRQFTVPGDANLVAGSIRSGISIFGVAGNVTLPATAVVRTGTSYGVGGNGSSGGLVNCSTDGGSDCVVDSGTSYRAASTTGLASKVISTASVAAVTGNVVLPATTDVKQNIQYGVNGTGLTGSFSGSAVSDCTADGQSDCKIPATGTIKAADTSNFTGWDIRRKRNQTTGAVLTFAGIASQGKSHCRNRANRTIFDNGTAPATASTLDVFDTIDDYNNNLTGLPGEIPAWTIINSTNYGADFACGGIYATGNTATGNTGADASLAHDPNGNWQDLTPGILPGGSNSTNTANGCNASDKHCVFRELISGLMVTEVSAATLTWANAISYCDNLGKAGGAVTSPIPVIGGATYSDWRLPTQKELMQIYQGGVRSLNQTSNLTTFFGDVNTWFWSSSSVSNNTSVAWRVGLGHGGTYDGAKTNAYRVVCVR